MTAFENQVNRLKELYLELKVENDILKEENLELASENAEWKIRVQDCKYEQKQIQEDFKKLLKEKLLEMKNHYIQQ